MSRKITFGLKACVKCKMLVDEKEKRCPNCGSNIFSREWSGLVIVYKPEKSELAQMLGITKPGKYALKVM